MSLPPPSEELLIQRQLRAAEIALETARRRRLEADAAVQELETRLESVAATVAAAQRERDSARLEAAAAVEAARAEVRAADRRAAVERRIRLEAEEELGRLRERLAQRDALTRQLTAEARLRALEGELELVRARAAAFEWTIRSAAERAFTRLTEAGRRVDVLLAAADLDPATAPLRRRPAGPTDPVDGPSPEPSAGPAAAPAPAGAGLDFGSLDAALARLRAAAPEPDPGADPPA